MTPAYAAAEGGHVGALQLLRDCGANLEAPSNVQGVMVFCLYGLSDRLKIKFRYPIPLPKISPFPRVVNVVIRLYCLTETDLRRRMAQLLPSLPPRTATWVFWSCCGTAEWTSRRQPPLAPRTRSPRAWVARDVLATLRAYRAP